MKRLALWAVSTMLLMLVAGPFQVARAATGAQPLGAAELASVTAGLCINCASDPVGNEPPKPPTLERYVWEVSSQKAQTPTQLSHALARDYSNPGTVPVRYQYAFDTECTRVLTSGGFGVSTGLNMSIGTVQHCSVRDTVEITVPARTRVKLYKGNMRQLTTVTVSEMAVYSDGSKSATGRTESGTIETRYVKYTTISSAL